MKKLSQYIKPLNILLCVVLFLLSFSISAQSITGSIQGKVSNEKGEPLPFASVVLLDSGKVIAETTSDFDGFYSFESIDSGKYTLAFSSVAFQPDSAKNVLVNTNKVTLINGLISFYSEYYFKKLAEQKRSETGIICRLPARKDIKKIAARRVRLIDRSPSLDKRLAKEAVLYVDGHKVKVESVYLPSAAIRSFTTSKWGISARYNETKVFKTDIAREIWTSKGKRILEY